MKSKLRSITSFGRQIELAYLLIKLAFALTLATGTVLALTYYLSIRFLPSIGGDATVTFLVAFAGIGFLLGGVPVLLFLVIMPLLQQLLKPWTDVLAGAAVTKPARNRIVRGLIVEPPLVAVLLLLLAAVGISERWHWVVPAYFIGLY